MSFFSDIFGSEPAQRPQPTKTRNKYDVTLPSGQYTVTTDLHHDHPDWPHRVAEAIRSVVNQQDLDTFRSAGGVATTVSSLAFGMIAWARTRKMEAALETLLKRSGHL